MMRALLCGALLLSPACAAQRPWVLKELQPCITACGLSSWDVDCRELQMAESVALAALEQHTRWKRPAMCSALKGWDVRVHAFYSVEDATCSENGWLLHFAEGPQCVGGYTHIATRSVEIEADTPLLASSLTHELAHVIDIALTGHIGHCRWTARGIREAIYRVSGKVDSNTQQTETGDCAPDGGLR